MVDVLIWSETSLVNAEGPLHVISMSAKAWPGCSDGCMRKRVAIATIGTSGDVRPYLALAKALQDDGHDVVLGTNADFEELVTSHGVEFHSLGTMMPCGTG